MFSTDLGSARPPVRGMFYSLVAHWLFAVATLMVPWSYWIPRDVRLVTMRTQARQQEALLLPDLQPMGGRSAAAPSPRVENEKKGNQQKPSAARGASAAVKAVRGVAYPGPQIIVSNPPQPDNFRQTILQPDLPSAPKLPRPLPVPPMVSIAPATPVLAPQLNAPHAAPAPPPVPVLPLSASQQLPRVEAPKLPLPAGAQASPLGAVASAPVPSALPKLARPPVPLGNEAANATHNVLVVDAIPVPNAQPAELPPGELHGAFTVSPSAPATSTGTGAGGGAAAEGAPGVGGATGSGTYAGTGTGAGLAAGEGTAGATGAGAGAGTGLGSSTGGTGSASGTGLGNSASNRGTGLAGGAGLGNAAGSGNGSSAGAGLGSGSGVGTSAGAGNSPFPFISIQGGSSGAGGGRTRTAAPVSGEHQTSYGMTIVASGASGGGFPDFGVFTEGASYTVYLSMADAGVRTHWTLQYAPDLRPAPNSSDPPPQVLGTLEPPYAITKSLPHISAEAAKRSRGAMVVVFGVVDRNGQFESLRIMQSPDPGLNRLVLQALSQWTFQPAKANGVQIPVKCLLGISVDSLPLQ